MNLVLDFGNTCIKAAIFEKNELVSKYVFNTEEDLVAALNNFKGISNGIIGSVTNRHNITFKKLSSLFNTLLFTSQTPIPLTNLYKSASTLGSDRMAAAVGAYTMYPNQNVLTIDAGTCIKYNFVNARNEYLGGAISPGINMRLKAMNYYTAALPLLVPDFNYDKLTGQNTHESLQAGALLGLVFEVQGAIERYEQEYNNLVVVVTGGDMDYLYKKVKSRFFASQNLLLTGLNAILNFNLEK